MVSYHEKRIIASKIQNRQLRQNNKKCHAKKKKIIPDKKTGAAVSSPSPSIAPWWRAIHPSLLDSFLSIHARSNPTRNRRVCGLKLSWIIVGFRTGGPTPTLTLPPLEAPVLMDSLCRGETPPPPPFHLLLLLAPHTSQYTWVVVRYLCMRVIWLQKHCTYRLWSFPAADPRDWQACDNVTSILIFFSFMQ